VATLGIDDAGIVVVAAVASSDVGLGCFEELGPIGVVAAFDHELDVCPEVALDAVQVVGVGRVGKKWTLLETADATMSLVQCTERLSIMMYTVVVGG
jgi:hypothetical protein